MQRDKDCNDEIQTPSITMGEQQQVQGQMQKWLSYQTLPLEGYAYARGGNNWRETSVVYTVGFGQRSGLANQMLYQPQGGLHYYDALALANSLCTPLYVQEMVESYQLTTFVQEPEPMDLQPSSSGQKLQQETTAEKRKGTRKSPKPNKSKHSAKKAKKTMVEEEQLEQPKQHPLEEEPKAVLTYSQVVRNFVEAQAAQQKRTEPESELEFELEPELEPEIDATPVTPAELAQKTPPASEVASAAPEPLVPPRNREVHRKTSNDQGWRKQKRKSPLKKRDRTLATASVATSLNRCGNRFELKAVASISAVPLQVEVAVAAAAASQLTAKNKASKCKQQKKSQPIQPPRKRTHRRQQQQQRKLKHSADQLGRRHLALLGSLSCQLLLQLQLVSRNAVQIVSNFVHNFVDLLFFK